MNFIILAGLIFLNGFFAMTEIALMVARKNRLKRLADKGDKAAARALRLGEDPTYFLSTIQIGITAIGILNGIVGQAALAGSFASWLEKAGLNAKLSSIGATAIIVVVITYLTIVMGELVPKRIAQLNAVNIAKRAALPISFLAKLSKPLVFILSVSTDGILKLFGKNMIPDTSLTEEDIHAIISKGSEKGLLKKQEHEVVRNIFLLDERSVDSMMTPRTEVVYIDINEPLENNLKKIAESDYSRFPVCRGAMHDILGIIASKRLFKRHLKNGLKNITNDLEPPVFAPETLSGIRLIEQFRESGSQMIFVVDEYGEISGIITLQDLLEAIIGEFKPKDPRQMWAVQRKDGSWLLDGMIPIQELVDRLNLQDIPGDRKESFNTLSGMMMWLIGNIPNAGDITEWEDWQFEVMDVDGNRVGKVLARNVLKAEPKGTISKRHLES